MNTTWKKKNSNDFDVIPKLKDTPNYAYRRDPIRKRSERMQLPGQVSMYCAPFYESIAKVHGEAEVEELIERYSRHRDEYPLRSNTPPGLWNPVFTDAELADSSSKYIYVQNSFSNNLYSDFLRVEINEYISIKFY